MFQQGKDSFFRSKNFSSNFSLTFSCNFFKQHPFPLLDLCFWSVLEWIGTWNWMKQCKVEAYQSLKASMANPNTGKIVCNWAEFSSSNTCTSIIEEKHHKACSLKNSRAALQEVMDQISYFSKLLWCYCRSLHACYSELWTIEFHALLAEKCWF